MTLKTARKLTSIIFLMSVSNSIWAAPTLQQTLSFLQAQLQVNSLHVEKFHYTTTKTDKCNVAIEDSASAKCNIKLDGLLVHGIVVNGNNLVLATANFNSGITCGNKNSKGRISIELDAQRGRVRNAFRHAAKLCGARDLAENIF